MIIMLQNFESFEDFNFSDLITSANVQQNIFCRPPVQNMPFPFIRAQIERTRPPTIENLPVLALISYGKNVPPFATIRNGPRLRPSRPA
jgi:hypothetical protein